jgi:uncharacterized protein YneF (UPF0154 family)
MKRFLAILILVLTLLFVTGCTKSSYVAIKYMTKYIDRDPRHQVHSFKSLRGHVEKAFRIPGASSLNIQGQLEEGDISVKLKGPSGNDMLNIDISSGSVHKEIPGPFAGGRYKLIFHTKYAKVGKIELIFNE